MQVKVRQAISSDCRYIAEVMYESMLPGVGHGIFDAALEGTGVGPIAFHEALLVTRSNNWGQLDSFFILEADGEAQAAAMGAFFSNISDLRPITAEGFKSVSEHLGWSPGAARDFWRKYVSFFGLFGNAPQLAQPAQYVLEYVSVRPNFRGRGLHGLLVAAHANRAKSLQYKTLGHTAVFGNEAVLPALAKFGFREHSRFGPELYRGAFPGMIRFVYDIPED